MQTYALRRSHIPRTPEARAAAHKCPVESCRTLCSPGHVACGPHWKAIPQDLRRPLVMAFKNRTLEPTVYDQAIRMAEHLVQTYALQAA